MEECRLVEAREIATGPEYCPFHLASISEQRRILADCIEELSGRQAMLVILRYEGDCTFAEIAGIFGVSEVSVWKMHERILRILAAALNRQRINGLDEIL